MAPAEGNNGDRSPVMGSLRKGAKLGRYEIDDVLGHGAMATVFRARDGQLGRTVALKVMNLAIAARDDAGERFRREAQAVAALKHPGIVEIHDFAAATDHEPAYIVAELISGPTLRAFIDGRRGRLLPEVAVLIAAQVTDALAVAHDNGIVHRDVKPDNVMLEKTGPAARVVLTDFGVAHITGLETMTASGALVGSPAYMSPEQARGHDVVPASDIWAVGVLLYQMVTGALPFPGKDPFAVITAVARGTFKRASQVTATVSPELDQLIARCLQTDPTQRYPHARALAEDLRALLRQGLVDDELTTLRRFLDDPDGFEAGLRPRIADAAIERARQHVRRGELARALNQVGRATAYLPDHRGAQAVLRSISARRRWMRGAATLGVLAVVGVGAYLGWTALSRPRGAPNTGSIAATLSPARSPSPAPPVVAPPVPIPPSLSPAAPSGPEVSTAVAPGPSPIKRRPKRASLPVAKDVSSAPPTSTPPPTEAVTEAPATKEPAPAAPAAAPPPPATASVPGRVTLLSQYGLCHPSLDEHPTSPATTAEYRDVTPGPHQVFCAATPESPRVRAGEILVRPGLPVQKTIKWNSGKPHL